MNIIMTCGGTGGHIYPAIAIADKIKRMNPEADILFIGTTRGMENTIVPGSGYRLETIEASGFNRKNILKNVKTLRDVIVGGRKAAAIMDSFKPDLVIGTGGYVTGTVIMQAHKKGIPCYIHEQNAVPGMTNKMLEKYAKKVFVSFPESEAFFKDGSKLVFSGNPIRRDFLLVEPEVCRPKLGIDEKDFMVLVFGGSLGADILNQATLSMINAIKLKGIKVFFVTGKRYYEDIKTTLSGMANAACVTLIPYAENMPELIAASDLIISRAGAIAISEITASGKPSILIPSPNVTNNHQFYNAKTVADACAAELLEEKRLLPDNSALAFSVFRLANNREKLNRMAEASAKIGKIDAVDIIYENLNI